MDNKKIIKDLAFRYGRDERVIEVVTRHPFKYLHQLMQSDDERPFRIKYLGVFTMKNNKRNKGKIILGLL